jgi:flavin reductase (DIM6/NTAB) family NADH-FMN oxidoreductase RutF
MESTNVPHLSAIDQVFQMVDREIWIITAAADDGRRGGLVATWVSQASIDVENPMIVAGLAPNHHTTELIDSSKLFAAHLVSAEEIELIWKFGLSSGRNIDKLAGLALRSDVGQIPALSKCLAWLACQVIGHYDGGDRIYYFANVLDGGRNHDGKPLRQSDLNANATTQQRDAMKACQLADVAVLRPLHKAWLDAHRK